MVSFVVEVSTFLDQLLENQKLKRDLQAQRAPKEKSRTEELVLENTSLVNMDQI